MGDTNSLLPIVILGPTASGKTRLAVSLAERRQGVILSADSRQVYKGLDIGTGKDLEEYVTVPHYLIDLIPAGEKYDVSQYLNDAQKVLEGLVMTQQRPIICGGTGLYIQGLLQGIPYAQIPVDPKLRVTLEALERTRLEEMLATYPKPADFNADTSTKKRLIRAIEISQWLAANPSETLYTNRTLQEITGRKPIVFGISPPLEVRRTQIKTRLEERIEEGLIEEVELLLANGLHPDELIYYGLEYKYTTLYLIGKMDFDTFKSKLTVEIQRYAKRQMTYFRKMERDGITIHWLEFDSISNMLDEIDFILYSDPPSNPHL